MIRTTGQVYLITGFVYNKKSSNGSVENANKMIRRYFPKGTDFATVKQTDVVHALSRINNKPRKILGYKSSLQLAKEKGLILEGCPD